MVGNGRVEKLIAPSSGAEFSALKLLWQGEKVRRILDGEDCYPSQLELSLTDRCQLSCQWCVDAAWRRAFPGTWDPDVLLSRLAEFYQLGTRAITIEGGGEPLMHPEFDRIVLGAHDLGFHLGLITNGVALGKHAHLVPLFRWIRVSLDSYDEETYSRLKCGPYFSQVMSGLVQAVEARERAGSDTVAGVGYLGVLGAVDEMPLRRLAVRLGRSGVDYLQFRRVTEHESLDAGALDLSYLLAHETEEFRIYVHQMHEFTRGNAGFPCWAHRLVGVIAGSGDMFFCCRLRTAVNDWMGRIGNLYEQSVQEIWEGEAREEMIQKVLDPAFTSRFCPPCRHTKFNAVIARLLEQAHTREFI